MNDGYEEFKYATDKKTQTENEYCTGVWYDIAYGVVHHNSMA
jgi:hypothetical protein